MNRIDYNIKRFQLLIIYFPMLYSLYYQAKTHLQKGEKKHMFNHSYLVYDLVVKQFFNNQINF